jgi:hypothetical protein
MGILKAVWPLAAATRPLSIVVLYKDENKKEMAQEGGETKILILCWIAKPS